MSPTIASLSQVRVAVAAGAWTALVVPIGAKDALISIDDITASFRASSVNTLNVAGEGTYVAPTNALLLQGVCTEPVTVYINPSAPTTVQAIFASSPV